MNDKKNGAWGLGEEQPPIAVDALQSPLTPSEEDIEEGISFVSLPEEWLLRTAQKEAARYRLIQQVPYTDSVGIQWLEKQLAQKAFVSLLSPGECMPTDGVPVVFLDTETTGLDSENDEIIELAMVKALYSPSLGKFVAIGGAFDAFEEPGHTTLTPEISRITHITPEMVAGQRLNDEEVKRFLWDVQLMVAHNAKFDRHFMERRFPDLKGLNWICSCFDLEWQRGYGFASSKLELLMLQSGFFYPAHRAIYDVLALLYLFQTHEDAFAALWAKQDNLTLQLAAVGAPFDLKDLLKAQGFRWSSTNRVWGKTYSVSVQGWRALEHWAKLQLTEGQGDGTSSAVEAAQGALDRLKQYVGPDGAGADEAVLGLANDLEVMMHSGFANFLNVLAHRIQNANSPEQNSCLHVIPAHLRWAT